MDWAGEFWADEEEEEEDDDDEDDDDDDDVEEDEVDVEAGVGCCSLCPFLLAILLETEVCLGSGVRAGD